MLDGDVSHQRICASMPGWAPDIPEELKRGEG